MNEKHIGLHL